MTTKVHICFLKSIVQKTQISNGVDYALLMQKEMLDKNQLIRFTLVGF